jgi:hypothetical protein
LCQDVIKLRFKSRTSRIRSTNANYKTGNSSWILWTVRRLKRKRCPQNNKYELNSNPYELRVSCDCSMHFSSFDLCYCLHLVNVKVTRFAFNQQLFIFKRVILENRINPHTFVGEVKVRADSSQTRSSNEGSVTTTLIGNPVPTLCHFPLFLPLFLLLLPA